MTLVEVLTIVLLVAFGVWVLVNEPTVKAFARWVTGILAIVLALILIFT